MQERIPNPTQDVEIVKEGSNQAMIDKVMKEALEEAKAKSPDIPISDIDADAEMMSEINALFDKAALEMKDAAAQIKKDQVSGYFSSKFNSHELIYSDNGYNFSIGLFVGRVFKAPCSKGKRG